MAQAMCLELSQADLKAIGRSRGFEPETIASRELMQHMLLSEQGVAPAMASLTPVEIAGLHLLNCLQEQVGVEFFRRIYPAAVSRNLYASFTERFKGLFKEVKARLIQRGLLLFGTLPDTYLRGIGLLERRRFRFPKAFGALLPAPFLARQLDPALTGQHRGEVLRDKLAEVRRLGSAAASKPAAGTSGCWRLENGELFLGPGAARFRTEQLEAWQKAQFEAAVGYANKAQPEGLMPVPLLLYALSCLREHEWLAPAELLPLWKLALSGTKAPEPQTVCEAGHVWGCVEKIELDGGPLYRLPRRADSAASAPPEAFLQVENPQRVGIALERIPLAALERLCEISRLEVVEGELWASPNLVKLSHARADTLAEPMVGWLRERHPAFRTTMEAIEKRRGKLIVHVNLLVARVKDLALKVMLEKQFGGPGKLVGLSGDFVAFPSALLPEVQKWMKKSGHVIKSVQSDESESTEREIVEDE